MYVLWAFNSFAFSYFGDVLFVDIVISGLISDKQYSESVKCLLSCWETSIILIV